MGIVYLQKACSAEETIEAKRAFEQYAEHRGVRVQAYHADNGIFKAKKWVKECRQRKQDLTFSGVNAHHQNGIAERKIRELQKTTRAMLIHATKGWPGVVTIHLWPYAIRMAHSLLTWINKVQTKYLIIQRLTSTRNTGNRLDVQLTYSKLSSKGPREYTQNGMPELELASTWGNPRATIETWHWF